MQKKSPSTNKPADIPEVSQPLTSMIWLFCSLSLPTLDSGPKPQGDYLKKFPCFPLSDNNPSMYLNGTKQGYQGQLKDGQVMSPVGECLTLTYQILHCQGADTAYTVNHWFQGTHSGASM